MKTSLIQSQLMRNAVVITSLTRRLSEERVTTKTAQLSESRKRARVAIRKMTGTINKLANIQRALKAELLAAKFAKATVYKKHGKDDARYTAWLEGQQAAERTGDNYTPVEFFPPVESSVSCGC